MCGIFGYIGEKNAKQILLDGLGALEYRGYDSAGIYISGVGIVKSEGNVARLADKIESNFEGSAGIAHTRWATHGEPSIVNAHPHTDMKQDLWVVHNGIIENHTELKVELENKGFNFYSETDSEVLANLISFYYEGDLLASVQKSLCRVRGAYGIAVMHKDNKDEIIVARLGSPIVIGVAEGARFVSSDPAALAPHTREVVFLADNQIAILNKDKQTIVNKSGETELVNQETLDIDLEIVKKNGYQHFMLKEIHETPKVVRDTLRGRISKDENSVKLGGLESVKEELKKCNRLCIVGCGSAYLAGSAGRSLIETYARLPVDIELASEYRYKTTNHSQGEILLAISQSGETADTLAAIKKANSQGLSTLGLVNVVGSSVARETIAGVYNHAGPEMAVASTKAFVSQLVVITLISVLLGQERGMSKLDSKEIIDSLEDLPGAIDNYLKNTENIRQLAKKYSKYKNFIFIGRQRQAAIAAEGALKLKEVSYIHAETYPGGELKHGPIALLDEQFPVVALVPKDETYEKMLANIQEVKARKAPVLAVASQGDNRIADLADDVIYIPDLSQSVQPILTALSLHLLAYYIGVEKGHDVDRPRNLAKSVTVE